MEAKVLLNHRRRFQNDFSTLIVDYRKGEKYVLNFFEGDFRLLTWYPRILMRNICMKRATTPSRATQEKCESSAIDWYSSSPENFMREETWFVAEVSFAYWREFCNNSWQTKLFTSSMFVMKLTMMRGFPNERAMITCRICGDYFSWQLISCCVWWRVERLDSARIKAEIKLGESQRTFLRNKMLSQFSRRLRRRAWLCFEFEKH